MSDFLRDWIFGFFTLIVAMLARSKKDAEEKADAMSKGMSASDALYALISLLLKAAVLILVIYGATNNGAYYSHFE